MNYQALDKLYGTSAFDQALAELPELTPRAMKHIPVDPETQYHDDPLNFYLAELSKVPWPSAAEETDLFNQGGLDAKRQIVESHLWLVAEMAAAAGATGEDLLDLIQSGNVALMQAIDSFQQNRGYRFARYAAYWVDKQLHLQ